MSNQILFFNKNKIDLENPNVQITITDLTAINNGQSTTQFLRNRNNHSAWMTTGSDDAANTQIDVSFSDPIFIDTILLIAHNFKSYTIQYFNGAIYEDFTPAINVANDEKTTTYYDVANQATTDLRIIITGTKIVDKDKILKQLIITEKFGQFEGWPEIKRPKIDLNTTKTKMLDGKSLINDGEETFSCALDLRQATNQNDIDLIAKMYFSSQGFLIWLNANDSDQFRFNVKIYRSQDIFLVRPMNDYGAEFPKGIYVNGPKTNIKLTEVFR